ncbi:MAG: DNA integrity scanning protein DisA nucleotide-binding domain protein [Phycisphaerales bacterium]|nr:DNA integrity scanning protein DisA nucleotide-binding domain protein [Phycisphaerales bacterium]
MADCQSSARYSYPRDLALFVHERWNTVHPTIDTGLLPDVATLEEFFSACYHASVLREEDRPVTFRATLAPPELFAVEARPPDCVQRIDFARPLPFHPDELQRLAVATDPQRTLIGVHTDRAAESGLSIWGLIHSGTRWLRDIQGGRRAAAPLPPVPVVHVHAPGNVEVYKAYGLVGKLRGGCLSGTRVSLFESQWLPAQFSQIHEAVMKRHEVARQRARETWGEHWAPLDTTLPRRIGERMLKRVISVLRDARHGGMIIFIPEKAAASSSDDAHYLDCKYVFEEGRPSFQLPDLIVDILNRLTRLYGAPYPHVPRPVGWHEFEATTDEDLATLDETLFEIAHQIAGLASADGAVVLSNSHELLGFGAMISGRLPDVRSVARALDLEGARVAEEETANVGARHRSAYRLTDVLPGTLVVVVSQDGGVRFVSKRSGRVTFWEQD